MNILELQLLGRTYVRKKFLERNASLDAVVLEAFKSFDAKDEVRIGLDVFGGCCPQKSIKQLLGCNRLIFNLNFANKRHILMPAFLSILVHMQVFFAVFIVIPLWLIDQVRYRTFSAKTLNFQDEILGFYPENSTRSRALANHIKGREVTFRRYQVVLLGRPRMDRRKATSLLRSLLESDEVEATYPVISGSVLCVLAKAFSSAKSLASEFYSLGYVPAFTNIVGALYRICHGHASESWVELHFPEKFSGDFWLCHTGLGDTSLLERSLHRKGVRTMHWVHGVSDGLNFVGVSSIGYFRTQHDVEWHQRLGGYTQCLMQPSATKDALSYQKASKDNFLLCSSYAHPMNLGFHCEGIKYEIEALEIFAEAVRIFSGTSKVNMLWKPHPVFSILSEFHKKALIEKAVSLGFSFQFESVNLSELLSEVMYVAATTSTIVFDMSDAGRTPVLLCLQPLDAQHSLASVPFTAKSVDELVFAWKQVEVNLSVYN